MHAYTYISYNSYSTIHTGCRRYIRYIHIHNIHTHTNDRICFSRSWPASLFELSAGIGRLNMDRPYMRVYMQIHTIQTNRYHIHSYTYGYIHICTSLKHGRGGSLSCGQRPPLKTPWRCADQPYHLECGWSRLHQRNLVRSDRR